MSTDPAHDAPDAHDARVEDVFDQVAQAPQAKRAALLDSLCGTDLLLRGEVEELLSCLSRATTQLDVSPIAQAFSLPETLGNYRIIRSIGRGGMGEVFEAEQSSPRRLVALKVIRGGYATPRTIRRFDAEAAALAQLKHPYIAQIYESGFFSISMPGCSPERRPYLAMELVTGSPLDAAARGLDTRAKLHLMADIADAIHHAHQRGVIHRDLKPANILAETTEAGGLTPKILDFGIARLTGQDAPPTGTLATEPGQMMGTLGFMSPEQVRSRPDEIDTRTDIYALGVTTYLLLAEKMPIDLGSKSAFEAAQAVIEQEPARLGSLVTSCRGDIETIVATAMHKDKDRRYASAAEFAADLRRYLANEPISARPPSTSYIVRKFAQRHKALVAASALIILLLAGSSVALSIMYLEVKRDRTIALEARAKAEAEARTLNATVSFLVEDTLGQASPSRKGLSLKVIDVLNDATTAVDARFAADPVIRARVRSTLSNLLHSIGQYEAERPVINKALEELESAGLKDSAIAAAVQMHRGIVESATGHAELAEPILRDALARCERSTDDTTEIRWQTRTALAEALQVLGKHDEAQKQLRDIIATIRPEVLTNWETAVSSRLSLAASLLAQNKTDEVEAVLKEAVQISQEHTPASSPAQCAALNANVAFLLKTGRAKEAAPLAVELFERTAANYPADHPQVGFVAANAAGVLIEVGQTAKAKELAARGISVLRKTYDDADYVIERLASATVATFESDGDVAGGFPYVKLWLQARLLAAGPNDGQGVIDRTHQFLLRSYKLNNATGPDRASLTMQAWADECRTEMAIIKREGGIAQSPHAARMLANLARSVQACSGQTPSNAPLVQQLLAQAREALHASARKDEDLALIVAVESTPPAK